MEYLKLQNVTKVFKLNTAITIYNLPGLVKKIIDNIRAVYMNDRVAVQRWDDLCDVRKIVQG